MRFAVPLSVALLISACSSSGSQPAVAGSPSAQVSASQPAVTATSSSSLRPAASASTTPTALTPEAIAAAERLSERLGEALARSDYVALRSLITQAGWVAGFYRSEGQPYRNRTQTIDLLRKTWPDGRLRIAIEPRPVLPASRAIPPGDLYVRSTWSERTGVSPYVWLSLRYEGGKWAWSGALFNVPAADATAEPDPRPRCDPEGTFGALAGMATASAVLEGWQPAATSGVDVAPISPEWVGIKYAEQNGLMTGVESTALVWREPDVASLILCSARTKIRIELFRAFPAEDESVWGARGHRELAP
jgi:hypothetical protein